MVESSETNASAVAAAADIAAVLEAALGSYENLNVRIRSSAHQIACQCTNLSVTINYPSVKSGNATVKELVDLLADYIVKFALPNKQIQDIFATYGTAKPEQFIKDAKALEKEALSLFIKAHKATNRNGEAGELLLFVLTEWLLKAPQILAKLALKTNQQMPVHGSDGVHVRYDNATASVIFYSGEAKLYKDIKAGIASAAGSIATSLEESTLKFELNLIERHITLAGLDAQAELAILAALDPFDEAYNKRKEVTTCLIGFDLKTYQSAIKDEVALRAAIIDEITSVSSHLDTKFKASGIHDHAIELFFFPVPAVAELRSLFQEKI